jgi:hypothetical protein
LISVMVGLTRSIDELVAIIGDSLKIYKSKQMMIYNVIIVT